MTDPITPTQADRYAYDNLMDDPCYDDPQFAPEHFARHRIAAEERGARWAIEAGAKQVAGTNADMHRNASAAYLTCCKAIRALDPKAICDSARETDDAA